MKMTPAQLGRVAANLLKVVRSRRLDSLDALGRVAEQPLDPDADDRYAGEEYVIVRRRDERKYSIDYFRRHGQTPIMFMVDASSVKCLLTVDRRIEGYEAFEDTPDGKMQDRALGGGDLALVTSELESLMAWSAAAVAGEDPRSAAVDEALECAYGCGDAAEAIRILTPALATARAVGDERRIAGCLLLLGQAERHADRPEPAVAHLEEALTLGKKTRDLGSMDAALGNLLGLSRDQGRYPEARDYGERLLEVCEARGDDREVGLAHYNLAYVCKLEGNLSEANRCCARALRPLMMAGDVDSQQAVHELQAEIHDALRKSRTPGRPERSQAKVRPKKPAQAKPKAGARRRKKK